MNLFYQRLEVVYPVLAVWSQGLHGKGPMEACETPEIPGPR